MIPMRDALFHRERANEQAIVPILFVYLLRLLFILSVRAVPVPF